MKTFWGFNVLVSLLALVIVEGATALVRNVTMVDVEGTTVMYRVPMSPNPVKGVVMLFHGCGHSVGSFFSKDEVVGGGCDSCLGLPQDRGIVADIVGKGYVAVALNSKAQEGSQCWVSGDVGEESDLGPTLLVRGYVYKHLNLEESTTPLVLYGVSSGGYFAYFASVEMQKHGVANIKGLVVMIATLRQDLIVRDEFNRMKVSKRPPPTVLVAMFRDHYTAVMNNRALRQYMALQVPIVEHVAYPKVVSADFVTNNTYLDAEQSKKVVKMLAKFGHLNKHMELKEDPLKSPWRKAVRYAVKSDVDVLMNNKSPMFQAMKVAWAEHEITNEFTRRSLNWLEAVWANPLAPDEWPGGGLSLAKLSEIYPS